MIAQGNALGKVITIPEALKARNSKSRLKALRISLVLLYFAPSALGIFTGLYLGRWPRLLHFAPLALRATLFTQSLPLPVLIVKFHCVS